MICLTLPCKSQSRFTEILEHVTAVVALLRQQEQPATIENVAWHAGIRHGTLRMFLIRHKGVASALGIIRVGQANREMRARKYKVIAERLKKAGAPIVFERMADEFGCRSYVIFRDMKRDPSLRAALKG